MVTDEREMVRSWLANLTVKQRRELRQCGSPHPERQAHTVTTEFSDNGRFRLPVDMSVHAHGVYRAAWAYAQARKDVIDDPFALQCCELVWGKGMDQEFASKELCVDRTSVRRALAMAASLLIGRLKKDKEGNLTALHQLHLFEIETVAPEARPLRREKAHRDGAELVSMVQGRLFDMEAV